MVVCLNVWGLCLCVGVCLHIGFYYNMCFMCCVSCDAVFSVPRNFDSNVLTRKIPNKQSLHFMSHEEVRLHHKWLIDVLFDAGPWHLYTDKILSNWLLQFSSYYVQTVSDQPVFCILYLSSYSLRYWIYSTCPAIFTCPGVLVSQGSLTKKYWKKHPETSTCLLGDTLVAVIIMPAEKNS